jgi:hypothetical protein
MNICQVGMEMKCVDTQPHCYMFTYALCVKNIKMLAYLGPNMRTRAYRKGTFVLHLGQYEACH